jgi:uncharacterized protein
MTTPVTLALVTGLLGSLHCAAMCGPLAVAGSAGGRGLRYFAGRLVSYAAVGAIMGTIGQHALCLLPVDRAQLIAVGGVAAFAAWKAIATWRGPRGARPIALGRRRPPLLARVLALLPRRGFGLGLATGVLPCGMLIPAWTLAMGAGGAVRGAAVMAAFFAGTAPGLLVPLWAGRVARGWLARVPRRVQAAAWAALALWIVARPLLGAVHQH